MNFPDLKEEQFAVLRVDYMTGHILASDFFSSPKEIPERFYAIFDSIDEAIKYIDENRIKYKNVEFLVFDNESKQKLFKEAFQSSVKETIKEQRGLFSRILKWFGF